MAIRQTEMFDRVQDQVEAASRTGGVTQVAKDPTKDRVQVAGIGDAFIKSFIKSYAKTIKPTVKETPKGADKEVAGNVPTPRQERILEVEQEQQVIKANEEAAKKGEPVDLEQVDRKDYQKTQKFFAEKLVEKGLLSQERFDILENNNFKIETKQQKAEKFEAKQKEEKIFTEARKAVKDDMEGYDPQKPYKPSIDTLQKASSLEKEFSIQEALNVDKDGIQVNFDFVQGADDVFKVKNALTKIYADEIDKVKRGVQSEKDTIYNAHKLLGKGKSEADQLQAELGMQKEMFDKKFSDLKDYEMVALRMVLERSTKRLYDTLQEIKTYRTNNDGPIPPELAIKFHKQFIITGALQVKKLAEAAEAGRKLRSFRIPVGASNNPDFMKKVLRDAKESAGDDKYTIKLMNKLDEAAQSGGNAAMNKLTRLGQGYKSWINRIYVNGLLSGPKTLAKNILGTPVYALYQLPRDIIAAGIFSPLERGVRNVAGRQSSEYGVSFNEISTSIYGMVMGIRNALAAGGAARKSGVGYGPQRVDGDAYGSSPVGDDTLSRFYGAIGKFIDLPSTGLLITDEFMKAATENSALYKRSMEAFNDALHQGKSEKDAIADAMEIHLDPRASADYTEEIANTYTLTSDPGFIGQVTNKFQSTIAGRFLVPFARVPTNSVFRTMENTPLGIASQKTRDALFRRGSRERQKALASITYGSAVMMGIASLALEGRITGGYPSSSVERRKLPNNWQPYSMVFRGEGFPVDADGDELPMYDENGLPNGPLNYVSYAGLEPVGAVIGIAAQYIELGRRNNDPEFQGVWNKFASKTVLSVADYFMELPMLQGIQQVFKSFEYEDMSYLTDGILKNMIPYSSLIRAGSTLIDPESERYSPEVKVYTLQDPEAQQNTKLVGTPKGNNFFIDMMNRYEDLAFQNTKKLGKAAYEKTGLSLPDDGEVSPMEENFAPIYNVYGEKKTRGVSFGVNPVEALRNVTLPFEIKRGKALKDYEREAINLDMPLTEGKRKYKNIPLSRSLQAHWTNVSKNIAVGLPDEFKGIRGYKNRSFTFREALDELLNLPAYQKGNNTKKRNMFKSIEDFYYEEGMAIIRTNVQGYEEPAELILLNEAILDKQFLNTD